MTTYTHTGYRPTTGHVHVGGLYGHRDYRGKVHALAGPRIPYEGAEYVAVCGETVRVEEEFGVGVDGSPRRNVAAGTEGVTCRRCCKVIAANHPPAPSRQRPGVP